jgi:hypothetical protein
VSGVSFSGLACAAVAESYQYVFKAFDALFWPTAISSNSNINRTVEASESRGTSLCQQQQTTLTVTVVVVVVATVVVVVVVVVVVNTMNEHDVLLVDHPHNKLLWTVAVWYSRETTSRSSTSRRAIT